MAQFDLEKQALVGAGGLLSVRADDEITRKLSMLIEGECEGLGPSGSRTEVRLQQATLLSVAGGFRRTGRAGTCKVRSAGRRPITDERRKSSAR